MISEGSCDLKTSENSALPSCLNYILKCNSLFFVKHLKNLSDPKLLNSSVHLRFEQCFKIKQEFENAKMTTTWCLIW